VSNSDAGEETMAWRLDSGYRGEAYKLHAANRAFGFSGALIMKTVRGAYGWMQDD